MFKSLCPRNDYSLKQKVGLLTLFLVMRLPKTNSVSVALECIPT